MGGMAEHDGAVEGESRSAADLSVAQDGKCQTECGSGGPR